MTYFQVIDLALIGSLILGMIVIWTEWGFRKLHPIKKEKGS